MSQSSLIFLDSIYGNRVYDANNTSGNVLTPFNTSFTLNTQFRNIKKFSLESIELGCGFPSIRSGSTNYLIININSVAYTLTIPESNYSTITAVVQALNNVTSSIISASGQTLLFTVTSNNFIQITSNAASLSLTPTNMSKYILGFQTTDIISGGYLTATGNYNLNPDNYLVIFIPQIGSVNVSALKTTFKLPLNSITNQIYYFSSGYGFKQEIVNTNSSLILNQLNVMFYDRFGCGVNPLGLEWSATIRVDYDA